MIYNRRLRGQLNRLRVNIIGGRQEPSPTQTGVWSLTYSFNNHRSGQTAEYLNTSATSRVSVIRVLQSDSTPTFNMTIDCRNNDDFQTLFTGLVEAGVLPRNYYIAIRNCIILNIDKTSPASIRRLVAIMLHLRTFEPSLDNSTYFQLCNDINRYSGRTEPLIEIPEIPAAPAQEEASVEDILNSLGRTTDPVRFGLEQSLRSARADATLQIALEHARLAQQTRPAVAPLPTAADIALLQAEAQSFAEHYGHTSATYRPSQSAAPAMPDIGANAKALEGIDIEVPNNLCCGLSLEIMTNPVRFAGISNKDCFEEAWIMEYLRNKNTHPITRENVNVKMLVADLTVKRDCDKFTTDTVNRLNNRFTV